jgi:hypothetical protein
MNIHIITKPLELEVYGYSAFALDKDYAGTAFKLMDKMWQTVKSNELKNKGQNIWIYEDNERVFAGIELDDRPGPSADLEQKRVSIPTYSYYKHIGPYSLIKQVGQAMQNDIKDKGFEVTLPYIEIYGHWTEDEFKLETELLMTLK